MAATPPDVKPLHGCVETRKRGPHDWIATCSCGKSCEDTSRARASGRLDRHIEAKNHELCPKPLKKSYPSQVAAERAVAGTWRRARGEVAARRAYQCEGCGSWHLTSQPK